MARLMVVSKDNGDTKMLLPIVRCARELCHAVIIMAEGVGVEQYAKAGIKTFFSDVPNPDPKTSFDVDALLRYLEPDAVLVGFPGPNHLSKQIGLEANRKLTPVIGVEDYWGGAKREPELRYSLVLTIDDYAADIAKEVVGPRVKVAVVGNHAIPNSEYRSPDAVLEGMEKIRSRFE